MTIQITNMRGWVLGLVVVAGAGCRDTIENEDHCWVAKGNKTCMELFGGGFCSNDHKDCEGYEVPYGCVFEKPRTDECYSPNGNNASCAGSDPAPECTEVAGESGESGMSESSETSEPSETSETSETSDSSGTSKCGDGVVEGDEECDDPNDDNMEDCTDVCTLPVCGDGIESPGAGEACDDHNMVGGDECTADCQDAGTVIWGLYHNISGPGDDVGHEVEIDPQGNIDILVAHHNEYRILQFKATGEWNWETEALILGFGIDSQTNLAVGYNGQLVVGGGAGDNGIVQQFNIDGGSRGELVTGPDSAVLAVDWGVDGAAVAVGYREEKAFLLKYDGMDTVTLGNDYEREFGLIAIGVDDQIRVWQSSQGKGRLLLFGSELMPPGMLPEPTSIGDNARAMDLDGEGNAFVLTQNGNLTYTLCKFDSAGLYVWHMTVGTANAKEGADGLTVLPNGVVIVAGYIEVSGIARGKLSWFSPDDGENFLNIIVDEENADADLTAKLYDVAVSPDGYAVAVGSRKEADADSMLWIRKFAI